MRKGDRKRTLELALSKFTNAETESTERRHVLLVARVEVVLLLLLSVMISVSEGEKRKRERRNGPLRHRPSRERKDQASGS
jgi:hypothetical protein